MQTSLASKAVACAAPNHVRSIGGASISDLELPGARTKEKRGEMFDIKKTKNYITSN